MNPSELNGKLFAVVLSDENDRSETLFGTARWNGAALTLDRGSDLPSFPIREEWFARIQPVTSPVVRAVLNNADYWIRLQLGAVTSDYGKLIS